MTAEQHETIDALLAEDRTYPPSEEFKAEALVVDTSLYDDAAKDDEGFWARQAAHLLDCIEQGVESHCNAADAWKSHAVCFAADQSGAEGRPVETPSA